MGRPRKYASDAERQAAYRQRYVVLQMRVKRETAETLERISEARDIPRADLLNELVAFALANRNWYDAPAFTRSVVSRPQGRRVATKFAPIQYGEDDDDD